MVDNSLVVATVEEMMLGADESNQDLAARPKSPTLVTAEVTSMVDAQTHDSPVEETQRSQTIDTDRCSPDWVKRVIEQIEGLQMNAKSEKEREE